MPITNKEINAILAAKNFVEKETRYISRENLSIAISEITNAISILNLFSRGFTIDEAELKLDKLKKFESNLKFKK